MDERTSSNRWKRKIVCVVRPECSMLFLKLMILHLLFIYQFQPFKKYI